MNSERVVAASCPFGSNTASKTVAYITLAVDTAPSAGFEYKLKELLQGH